MEFPGTKGEPAAWELLPQICVVSEIILLETAKNRMVNIAQHSSYENSIDKSNHAYLLSDKQHPVDFQGRMANESLFCLMQQCRWFSSLGSGIAHIVSDVWKGRGRAEIGRLERVYVYREKKRSSQASWITCSLGTPFPRSALFLLTILWKTPESRKSTEAVGM
jgi:hypothetical protein